MKGRRTARPTESDRDPSLEWKKKKADIRVAVKELVTFAPIILYLWVYWRAKEHLRRYFRTGALYFLSFSLLFLLLEIVAEVFGHSIASVIAAKPSLREPLLFGLAVAVLILLLHHHAERRHDRSEFILAERLWEFLSRRGLLSYDDTVVAALRLFHDVFRRYKIAHVSLARLDADALRIAPAHVFPESANDCYVTALPTNDGVAGLVYSDANPRYVPRLFIPIDHPRLRRSWSFFPHALKFEIRQSATEGLTLVQPRLDRDAFKLPSGVLTFPYSSFLTAPLKPFGSQSCIGVLNFDFSSPDPLTRAEITMGVILAQLLADELQRIAPPLAPAATLVASPNSSSHTG